MVKISFILILQLMSSLIYAQDMKGIATKDVTVDEKLARILKEDKTDENAFDPEKYVCHQFAKTFYLQRSTLVENLENYDLKGIADDWGVIIQRLEESEKLPIYTVTLSQKEHGFYHMINAVLMDKEHPEKVESYVFIEPQSDAVMLTADDVYSHYRMHYKSDTRPMLKMDIGLFDSFKHNGNIYQSWGKQLYSFDLY